VFERLGGGAPKSLGIATPGGGAVPVGGVPKPKGSPVPLADVGGWVGVDDAGCAGGRSAEPHPGVFATGTPPVGGAEPAAGSLGARPAAGGPAAGCSPGCGTSPIFMPQFRHTIA
jgi:hypothetical protein